MSHALMVFDTPPAETAAAPRPAAEPPVTRLRPPGRWRSFDLREVWRYRELLAFLVWRDVTVRYRQTVLGVTWAVLQPVLMVVAFTVLFGRLAGLPSAGLPYPVFALAGLLPWLFFAAAVTAAGNSVIGSERLVTKVYFPRVVIPLAATGAAAADFLVGTLVLMVLMAVYGVAPGAGVLLAVPLAAVIGLAAAAIGTGLAALNVRYRDFKYVIPFLVQFWMFATPSVYMQPPDHPTGLVAVWLWANPMTPLVEGFRAACYGLPMPWGRIGVATVTVAAASVVALAYFRKNEDDFADVI